MKTHLFPILLLIGLIVGAADLHANPPGGHGAAPSPGIQSLDVSATPAALHLLLGELEPGQAPTLRHRRSTDAGKSWSDPVAVNTGQPAPHSPHRGNDPQIAAHADTVVAVWTVPGTGFMNSGPLATARSEDGGRTWQPGPNPADDGLTTGHAFVDLQADGNGTFHLVWLDGRDGSQGLRYARSTDGGRSWSRNLTLKAATCECCWNSLAVGRLGVHALFRDKDPRDMSLVMVALDSNRPTKPTPIGSFNWEFNGCPHVGGGLTLEPVPGGERLHALVWTGIPVFGGLYHSHSLKSGPWSDPKRLGPGEARRGDIAALAGGVLAACWEIHREVTGAVEVVLSRDGGASWSEPESVAAPGANAAYPRVLAHRDGFHVFWTETRAHQPTQWRHRVVIP